MQSLKQPICLESSRKFVYTKLLTSPRCESPHCPFVSGLAITTLTPGRSFPDSIKHKLWGAPLSTNVTLSLRRALMSAYTAVGSGLEAPFKKIWNEMKCL